MNAPAQIEVVAVTPAESEDRVYARKLAEMQANALPTLRSTAEKWAGSITALLGVVGLGALFTSVEAFDGLEEPDQSIAKATFFIAAVLALVAAGLAIRAAQNTSKRAFLPSRDQYELFTTQEAEDARGKLATSRWLAICAVAFVLVSAAVVWWGESSEPSPTVIEFQGTTLCENGGPATGEAEGATYVVRCQP